MDSCLNIFTVLSAKHSYGPLAVLWIRKERAISNFLFQWSLILKSLFLDYAFWWCGKFIKSTTL
ncbi:hypothetical protein I79_011455 [Cricetulus griseus]|uniref:Uncharacterized protein n=1 Tax=Cricetulus griseus TaxID=10029 RepID=G3HL70_CRIGR|nr:hypothetical protein I79_011455 [Cricetulus griseus]